MCKLPGKYNRYINEGLHHHWLLPVRHIGDPQALSSWWWEPPSPLDIYRSEIPVTLWKVRTPSLG